MLMNFLKKISISLLIFVVLFGNFNFALAGIIDIGGGASSLTAEAIAEEVVNLFIDTVKDIGTEITEEITDQVGAVNEDLVEETQEEYADQVAQMEQDVETMLKISPVYQDMMEAFQQDDLEGVPIFFDVNGDGIIDYDDLGLLPDGTFDPNSPNHQNQVIISDILDRVMADLRDSGFFDDDENNPYSSISFTEEEFKLILGNILFRDIINQVIDPSTQLPRGVDIKDQLDFEIKINPPYPQPGDIIMMEVYSNSIDLNKSEITWLKSGKIILSGLGQKRVSNYKINSLGETEIITVKIQTENYGLLEKSITIQPAYVDFYFETDTYTPPFYKGKSAFVRQSQIKVIAMPQIIDAEGNRLSYRDFTYKWYLNNRLIDGKKTGENFIYIQDSYYNNQLDVNVVMEHLHSDLILSKSIILTPEEPEIVIYEEDPALGIKFNKAILDQKNTSDREFSIKVIPFNFNDKNNLEYKWQLDGNLISGIVDDYITFRANGSSDIDSMISVDVNNPISITQSKSHSLNIFVNN